MKRIFDLTMAGFLFCFLSVPIFVVGLIVKLTSRGPALYWSDRDSWNMDPDLLAEELEKGPERILVSKAVVAGHLWLKLPYLKPACICETKNIIIVSSNVL
jgi:hypothetical protein